MSSDLNRDRQRLLNSLFVLTSETAGGVLVVKGAVDGVAYVLGLYAELGPRAQVALLQVVSRVMAMSPLEQGFMLETGLGLSFIVLGVLAGLKKK